MNKPDNKLNNNENRISKMKRWPKRRKLIREKAENDSDSDKDKMQKTENLTNKWNVSFTNTEAKESTENGNAIRRKWQKLDK